MATGGAASLTHGHRTHTESQTLAVSVCSTNTRCLTLVVFYFPTDGNSVSLAALVFMESRPISAQLSAGYRFTTAHWDGDRRPITGSWACKASICGGNTEQIKPEEPTHTHSPIRGAVMTLRSVFMHTKVS